MMSQAMLIHSTKLRAGGTFSASKDQAATQPHANPVHI